MGRSRASKDQLENNGCIHKSQYAKGDKVDHWMQDVNPKKGALHKQLRIPQNEKISTERLEKAAHSDKPLLRKRANLALRYRGI